MAEDTTIAPSDGDLGVGVAPEDISEVEVIVGGEEADGGEDDIGPVYHMVLDTHEVAVGTLLACTAPRTRHRHEQGEEHTVREVEVAYLS